MVAYGRRRSIVSWREMLFAIHDSAATYSALSFYHLL
jgi:hypothetical protein